MARFRLSETPFDVASLRGGGSSFVLVLPGPGVPPTSETMAAALGANVRPNNVKEIGWYRLHPTAAAGGDPLCRHLAGEHHVVLREA